MEIIKNKGGNVIKTIVGVEKFGYIYKGNQYKYNDYMQLNEKLGVDREIVIMGEPLLVKVYNFEKSKSPLDNFVEDIIVKDFSIGEDLLFHYEFIKQLNKIYVYSIKKGVAVEKITVGCKSLNVVPIQFKIKEFINKKFKRYRTFIAIAKIRNIYYLVNVEDGFIINGLVHEDKDIIFNELHKYFKIDKEVILDRSISVDDENKVKELRVIQYLKIGEAINEKIFEKQKFYTKKLC